MRCWNERTKLKAVERLNAIDNIPWSFILGGSATKKKQELLALAKSGAERPRQKTKLGSALSSYTTKSSQAYDAEFDNLIRGLRPDWFINQSDRAYTNKQKIIELAKSGAPRPNWKTVIGKLLRNYITKTSNTYDPDFEKLIKSLRPDWFETSADINKRKIVELAKSGAPRPNFKTTLGSALSKYTSKGSKIYDADFDKEIRLLRPDWFRE